MVQPVLRKYRHFVKSNERNLLSEATPEWIPQQHICVRLNTMDTLFNKVMPMSRRASEPSFQKRTMYRTKSKKKWYRKMERTKKNQKEKNEKRRNGKHNEFVYRKKKLKGNINYWKNKNEPIREWHRIKAMECECL